MEQQSPLFHELRLFNSDAPNMNSPLLAQPVNQHKPALIKAIQNGEKKSSVSHLLTRYLVSEAERARQRAAVGDTIPAPKIDGSILVAMASDGPWEQFLEFLPHCEVFGAEKDGDGLLMIVAGMGGGRFEWVVKEMTQRDLGQTKTSCDHSGPRGHDSKWSVSPRFCRGPRFFERVRDG